MFNILVVEDDKDLNFTLSSCLKGNGFNVFSAYNGLDGLNMFYENKIDLVLSDIMMPLLDGYGLAKEIRGYDELVPIIFMSARDDKPSKQMGYRVGIDDYITKPFDLDELVFKVIALKRRQKIESVNKVEIGNFKMIKDEHVAYVNDEEINLTVREFDILYAMILNPKKIFTRSKLMEDFWDYDSSATSRTVDVYMAKLRDKTKNCNGFEIQTVHGLGYKVIINEKI